MAGVRLTTRHTFPAPGGVARWTVNFDADEDAEVIASAVRRAQREHGISRKPKSADAERSARLARFVAVHGTGASAYERWNRERPPADRHASRSSFYRAAKRVAA